MSPDLSLYGKGRGETSGDTATEILQRAAIMLFVVSFSMCCLRFFGQDYNVVVNFCIAKFSHFLFFCFVTKISFAKVSPYHTLCPHDYSQNFSH